MLCHQKDDKIIYIKIQKNLLKVNKTMAQLKSEFIKMPSAKNAFSLK